LSLDPDSVLVVESGSSLTEPLYILAEYGSLTGFFGAFISPQPGYLLDHNHNGQKRIALVRGPYLLWADARGLSGAAQAPDADPDGDGVPNAIEYVLGGEPNPAHPGSPSSALLPTLSLTATHVHFVFRRTDASAFLKPFVRYGSDLTGWTTAVHGTGGVTITTENDVWPGID